MPHDANRVIHELAAQEWYDAHLRVCALVEEVGPEAMQQQVPACPGWTATNLLSHVVGLGHDVLAGNEPDDHDVHWTQAQVDTRVDRSPAELLAEWRGDADRLVAYLREKDTRPVNDLIIHEQDLRGALDAPGGRDTAGLKVVREVMAHRLAGRVPDLAPVRLHSDDWTWTSHGSDDQEPGVVLEASSYDLMRALTSRRTAGQLRSWVTRGDVEGYLGAFCLLGPLPQTELRE